MGDTFDGWVRARCYRLTDPSLIKVKVAAPGVTGGIGGGQAGFMHVVDVTEVLDEELRPVVPRLEPAA